jgi:hypothetical protein
MVDLSAGATAQQSRNSRATAPETTVADTPLQQSCNSALATARNSDATATKQSATASQQRACNSATTPYRGGETVAPLDRRARNPSHPLSPRTALRLRLRLPGRSLPASERPSSKLTAGRAQGRKRPHHSIKRVDNQRGQFHTIALGCQPGHAARVIQRVFVLGRRETPASHNANPRPSYGLCAGSIYPCASRPTIRRDDASHKPLQDNATRRQRRLLSDQKGAPARAPGRWRNVKAGEMYRNRPSFDRGGVGGEGGQASRQIIDIPPLFRGFFPDCFSDLRKSGLIFPGRGFGFKKSRVCHE